tara:strand:- start:9173 stop:10171 length:999 start_codon:yes stop_codon:yes gene_type:complete
LNQFLRLHAIWNPDVYHGWGREKKFFEGWYYKIVSKNEKYAFAIIPGIAMDEDGNKQSFIQILDGRQHHAEYHKFDHTSFRPTPKVHKLLIENNFFSKNKLRLDLPKIKGELNFTELHPWSNSFLSPGIMGPYSFVPYMECYHGILSMNHKINGFIKYKEKNISFNDGKGYIEKDWGHSFPEAYIWMQSNHFSNPNLSIKISIAIIPWLRSAFIGHIAGVLFKNRIIEFTTYNGSKVNYCDITKKIVEIEIENKLFVLSIMADREEATTLAAPISGFMSGRIDESMNSRITLNLFDKKSNEVILNDTGNSAGIEVAGNYKKLLKKPSIKRVY